MTLEGAPEGLSVQVRRGDPTPEELAALIAVASEAYQAEAASAVADDRPAATVWSRTQRAIRTPLRRDIPWGRFTG